LIEDGNPGAFLLCQDTVPLGPDTEEDYGAGNNSPNMFASIEILTAPELGDSLFLRICYAENSEGISYLEYEWTRTMANRVEVQLYAVTNGVRASLAGLTGDCDLGEYYDAWDQFVLSACYSDGSFRGGSDIPILPQVVPWGGHVRAFVGYPASGSPMTGWRAGFGHNNDSPCAFGTFVLSQHYVDDHTCIDCGECYCWKEGMEEPVVPAVESLSLTATFTGCGGLDGKTVALNAEKCGSGGGRMGVARGWGFWEPHVDEFDRLVAYIVSVGCVDHGEGPGPEMSGPWPMTLNAAAAGVIVWNSDLFGPPPAGAVEGQLIYGITCACVRNSGYPESLSLLWVEESSSCEPLVLEFVAPGYHLENPCEPPMGLTHDCFPCDPDFPEGIEDYGSGDQCPMLLPCEEISVAYSVIVTG